MADLAHDVGGDVVGLLGTLAHEQHRVAERLDHPATTARHGVERAALELLDQLPDLVLAVLVAVRRERDQVGEPDGQLGGVQVLVVGAHRLDPGGGSGEVAAPGVDQQLLERRPHLLGDPQRAAHPAPGRLVAGLELLDPADQRGHLPVGEPGDRLPDGTRHPDHGLLVESTALHGPRNQAQRLDVGVRERGLRTGVGEAQRTPEPPRLLDREPRGERHVVAGQLRARTQDRVLEARTGVVAIRSRHRWSCAAGRAGR